MKCTGKKTRLNYFIIMLTVGMVSVFGVAFAWADTARVGIYYDGSGSMMGFFNPENNGIIGLNQKLFDVFAASHLKCNASVFTTRHGSTQVIPLQTFLENPQWGSETRLDEAMKMAVDSDIVVLVTDNVQDAGGGGRNLHTGFLRNDRIPFGSKGSALSDIPPF
jgi:hypothetical protein